MSEIKNESLERMPEQKIDDFSVELQESNIDREQADDVYGTIMEERYLDSDEDYNEKLGNMPIRTEILEAIKAEGCTFAEYCDKHKIEPEDCYEPTVTPYHAARMEELGMDIGEYCNAEGLNVDEILWDPECLIALYDKEKMERPQTGQGDSMYE